MATVSINRMVLVGLLVFMAMSCTSPRKAAERDCRKAERHMARAVLLCPELLTMRVDTDTITVVVPGGSGEGETGYTQADMDSVVKLCNELVNHAMGQRSKGHPFDSAQGRPSATTPRDRVKVIEKLMRSQLCELETVTHADSLLMLKIWTEDGKLRWWYNVLPQVRRQLAIHNAPVISYKQCPPEGVASGWRTYALVLSGLLLFGLLIVVLMVRNGLRSNDPFKQG